MEEWETPEWEESQRLAMERVHRRFAREQKEWAEFEEAMEGELEVDEPLRWFFSLRADPDVDVDIELVDDALRPWDYMLAAYRTPETVETVVRTIPGYAGISGYLYLFFAADGDVVVYVEDWLSGCIPRHLAEKHHPYPYEAEEVQDHCLQAILPQGKALDAALAPHGFKLVLDSPLDCSDDDCITRFAWVRPS